MSRLDFFLVNPEDVQIHFTDFPAAKFEPEYIEELVQVQAVLVGVIFEELSLSDDVVLIFFLFFLVDEVLALPAVC